MIGKKCIPPSLNFTLQNLYRKRSVALPYTYIMFGFLKRRSERQKLQGQYEKLMKESHRLSTISRAKSDKVATEAELVARQIEALPE